MTTRTTHPGNKAAVGDSRCRRLGVAVVMAALAMFLLAACPESKGPGFRTAAERQALGEELPECCDPEPPTPEGAGEAEAEGEADRAPGERARLEAECQAGSQAACDQLGH